MIEAWAGEVAAQKPTAIPDSVAAARGPRKMVEADPEASMKRDMDLARTILEQVEEKSEGIGIVKLDIQGHSNEEIAYHVMLLNQANFLKAIDNSSQWGMAWVPAV